MSGAFFIDRDGVINRMVNYDGKWDSPLRRQDVKLVDGITKVLSWLNAKGILVVEISNQPGVAKGKMSRETSDAIETRVHELLATKDLIIDHKYICPHHPRGMIPDLTKDCDCRKPKPGLLLQAARELDIDLQNSLFLGDGAVDIEAGKLAGVKTIIYLHNDNELEKVEAAKLVEADFRISSVGEIKPIAKKVFRLV